MDGFVVTTEALQGAAEATRRVAAAVAGADLAGPVRALAEALPGSRTGAVAGQAGAAWVAGVATLGRDASGHARALMGAMRSYADADAAAAAAITGEVAGTSPLGGASRPI